MSMNHQGFCLKITQHKTQPMEIPVTQDFNFGSALETTYPLLDIVFSYLDCEALETCSQVNDVWNEVAQNILGKRIKPSWFTCFRPVTKLKCPFSIWNSNNFRYDSASMGIIFIDIRRMRTYKKLCVHAGENSFNITSIAEYIEEKLVPKDVKYCVISCARVLSSFQQEMDFEYQYALDGLFLPKIPNIKTTMFYYPGKNELYFQNYEQNAELKCLLIFIPFQSNNKNQKRTIERLLKKLIPENNKTVAVGGGIVKGINSPQTFGKRSANVVFTIAFWQVGNLGADFNAFSCVIKGDCLSKNEFTNELLKFKEHINLRKHSTAIRICCTAKNNSNDEIHLFNEVFPKVPLLGFYAYGEIGWNNFPENDADQYLNVHHQWSTIFVVMTWGGTA